ncbi:type II secretion system F family protein [Mycobacterium yunnanensis]|uniref:Type II secretion system F family protein n=1 Tax=Mycobacterium yunnanensis TaxID=368477 RepID=A0A9X3C2A5_9MYCO|nr:type II secretion system F family protein [Mycobacterium yunnanensis]MCV7422333.1 type II secretion system F family protein [Mycobacterium yunnanensis]
MSLAAVLLALAALLAGGRVRAANPIADVAPAATDAGEDDDPLAAASALDVFAACLSSGMAVAAAAKATAPYAPHGLADVLERAADLLAVGADAFTVWSTVDVSGQPRVEALCRLARRSAASGSALAQAVSDLADQSRRDAADSARAAAERASVLIAGPLGVCYLPAFVCLGIVPVVVGLAGDVLQSGVW